MFRSRSDGWASGRGDRWCPLERTQTGRGVRGSLRCLGEGLGGTRGSACPRRAGAETRTLVLDGGACGVCVWRGEMKDLLIRWMDE